MIDDSFKVATKTSTRTEQIFAGGCLFAQSECRKGALVLKVSAVRSLLK